MIKRERVYFELFFFQAEDGIRDLTVTGVQTCALPISPTVVSVDAVKPPTSSMKGKSNEESGSGVLVKVPGYAATFAVTNNHVVTGARPEEIGRASCRERDYG